MVDYNKKFFGDNNSNEIKKKNDNTDNPYYHKVGDYNALNNTENVSVEAINENEVVEKKRKKRKHKKRSKGEILLFDYCLPIAIGLVIAFVLIHFFGRGVVNGSSMNPTLKDGQSVLIFKSNKNIKRNDIVFIHSEELEEDIVKRVVAVEGDMFEIRGVDVYVNGEKIDDSYTEVHSDEQYVKPMKIPEGYVYVLGDNRDNSTDSRSLGPIDIDDIFAKVIFK